MDRISGRCYLFQLMTQIHFARSARIAAGGFRVRRGLARVAVLAALGLVGALRPNVGATQGVPPTDGLSSGDSVRIDVWKHEELSGSFVVTPEGVLRHPLYREVRVTGLPLAALETRIREFLSRYETTPQFTIEPRFRVSVAGEVEAPRLYSFGPEVTVAQALVLAGGPTDRARLNRVRLQRGGMESLVDLTLPGEGLADSPIRSGDRIIVDRRRDVMRTYVAPVLSFVGSISSIMILLSYIR